MVWRYGGELPFKKIWNKFVRRLVLGSKGSEKKSF